MQKTKLLYWWLDNNHINNKGLLNPHFDIKHYHGSGDFQQIINQYQADIVVFRSGMELTNHGITITNVERSVAPHVPRIAHCDHDIHSSARYPFFMHCANVLHVEAIFCDYLSGPFSGNNYPPFKYVAPRYRNDYKCGDYGEPKTIPLAMLGYGFIDTERYPWRRQAYNQLALQFPIVTSPRPEKTNHSLIGEEYGRMLNRSLIAFGCGGIHEAPLLKLFEIPSCRTCLVCPPLEILNLYGFEDMKNCVMASENEILDKVTFLMEHRNKLEEITDAGFQHMQQEIFDNDFLVFFQWYDLWKKKKDDEVIIQESPLEPLKLAPKGTPILSSNFPKSPILYDLLNALNNVYSGNNENALPIFTRALNAINTFPEAHFGIAIIKLQDGLAEDAYSHYSMIIQMYIQSGYRTFQDPINWAYYLIAASLKGSISEALKNDAYMSHLKHPCLEAARFLIARLQADSQLQIPEWTNDATTPSFLPDPFKTAEAWHGFNERLLAKYKV